jgi:hypothetical protein
MNSERKPVTFRGRSFSIVALTAAQFLIGSIHSFFGLWLFAAGSSTTILFSAPSPVVYSAYTLIFGLLTLVFAVGIWLVKNWGWIGTVTVSAFVTVADALTLLNLSSIPGIPKFAAPLEILYSLIVLLYLSQTHVRIKFAVYRKSS